MNRWPDPAGTSTSFALLGRLEVRRGGQPVPVPGSMPPAVLTLLLLSRGEIVSNNRLADALWGEQQPVSATASLRNHVMRVRQALRDDESEVIQTWPGGYLIQVAPGDLDLDVFAELCDKGRRALREEQWEQAIRELTAALALWRGEPLCDLPASADVMARIGQLSEARLLAFEGRTEARLRLGRHQETITDLRALTAEYPLREAFHGQLMRALYRSGRQAEALDVFRALRRTLIEELAVEPSVEVRELHQRILAGDPLLDGQNATSAISTTGTSTVVPDDTAHSPPASSTPAPAQLPASVGDFAGRDDDVATLVTAVTTGDPRQPRVPIAAVTGGGGIGKTTLAVHVAHRLAELFPDGRLFVDLHGMDTVPRDPDDVLAQWLRDLGVAAEDVPRDLEARAAGFRSLTHDKRFLIVLDNARDAAQIRPLVPASPSCAVLITSRDRLAELPGCVRLELEPLPDSEALTMLEQIVGVDRLRAEPRATCDILLACSGLPLALRIAGSRLNARHRWSIQTLATRLADQRHRLTELQIGDLAARASFQVSYQALPSGPPGAPARLFRLLGLLSGPDVDTNAAAALAGVPAAEAEEALEILVDAHLLQTAEPGRYRAHDLLRDFARELADEEESPKERQAAVSRLLAWCIHATVAATDTVMPGTVHWGLAAIPDSPSVPHFADAEACMRWLLVERPNLAAAVELADRHLPGPEAWVLAAQLLHFYSRRGLWTDLHDTNVVGLRCAERLDDPVGRERMLSGISHALARWQRHDEALAAARGAMESAEETADPRLIAAASANYAGQLGCSGMTEEAFVWHRRSIAAMREIGHPEVLAATLVNFGIELRTNGRYEEADGVFAEALQLARDAGSSFTEASVLQPYALSRNEQGATNEAIGMLATSVTIHGRDGNLSGQANGWWHLGDIHFGAGRPDEARLAWTRALVLLDELGDPRAGQLRSKLREVVAPSFRAGHRGP